jgi:hypothetical protein
MAAIYSRNMQHQTKQIMQLAEETDVCKRQMHGTCTKLNLNL